MKVHLPSSRAKRGKGRKKKKKKFKKKILFTDLGGLDDLGVKTVKFLGEPAAVLEIAAFFSVFTYRTPVGSSMLDQPNDILD